MVGFLGNYIQDACNNCKDVGKDHFQMGTYLVKYHLGFTLTHSKKAKKVTELCGHKTC